MVVVLLIAGLLALVVGADSFVRGASRLATRARISPLIIGLTVVSFGTSAPEFGISIKASLDGQAALAVGNVVGSNIFNVLFILGISALIVPLQVSKQLLRLDVPIMIFVSLLAYALAFDQSLSRIDGGILSFGLVLYILLLYFLGKSDLDEEISHEPKIALLRGVKGIVLQVSGGLLLLVLGSRWFVSAAVHLAQALGVSELIIGLTIVSIGTSLPELMTSVVASIRGQRDIAVGNIVGSNIFNLLGVLGMTALVAPAVVMLEASLLAFDIPFMIAVACACLPIFFTGGKISSGEGAVLLLYYLSYTLLLILIATTNPFAAVVQRIMLLMLLPLSIVLVYSLSTGLKAQRKKSN